MIETNVIVDAHSFYWYLQCRKFLIAEYCGAYLFTGWHFYVRDSKRKNKRNDDGSWGWVRRLNDHSSSVKAVMGELGIRLIGDGTCDDDGIAEFVKRFPMPRQRIWGRPRGCIEINVTRCGTITLPEKAHS